LRDLSAVDRALANAEWKAATVLAGSLIEALLLWALGQKPVDVDASTAGRNLLAKAKRWDSTLASPNASLDYRPVGDYHAIAQEVGLGLTDETIRLAELARNFRNLIHPGRAKRVAEECNRGTALAAVGALERTIQDLGR